MFANKPFGCKQFLPHPWTFKKKPPPYSPSTYALIHYDAKKQWGEVYFLPQNLKCFQHPFWNPDKK
jgi:hypothetical protein